MILLGDTNLSLLCSAAFSLFAERWVCYVAHTDAPPSFRVFVEKGGWAGMHTLLFNLLATKYAETETCARVADFRSPPTADTAVSLMVS